jgi:hypothetical protein
MSPSRRLPRWQPYCRPRTPVAPSPPLPNSNPPPVVFPLSCLAASPPPSSPPIEPSPPPGQLRFCAPSFLRPLSSSYPAVQHAELHRHGARRSALYPCLLVGTNGQTCYIISVLLKYSLKICKNRKVPMWRTGSQRTGVGQPLMKRSDLRECLVTDVKIFRCPIGCFIGCRKGCSDTNKKTNYITRLETARQIY